MKKIVRNVFALLLALTFILSLAACGGNSASSGAAPAASGSEETSTVASTPETKDPVTLTVYTWWDVTKFEHLQKMKSDFEAENPDIKLEFVTIPSKCLYIRGRRHTDTSIQFGLKRVHKIHGLRVCHNGCQFTKPTKSLYSYNLR